MISKERATAIALHFNEFGKDATCRKFQIPEETLNRYLRAYRKETVAEAPKEESNDLLVQIAASKQN